jgi:hypothetical protein
MIHIKKNINVKQRLKREFNIHCIGTQVLFFNF